MKKSLLALALAGASFFAAATGLYDGVYQQAGSSAYLVVMQNGTTLGAAGLSTVANGSTVRWGSAATGYVIPATVGVWEIVMGPISGNVATVTGVVENGACNAVARMTFDGAGNVVMAGVSATPTALGLASGYNCAPRVAQTVTLQRVF